MNEKELEKKAVAYSIKNALSHGGKAQIGSVISGLFNEGLKKEELKKFGKKISEIVEKINLMRLEKQEEEFKKLEKEVGKRKVREGLPELPNSKKGVIMRIAPSPSGPFHIGHALIAGLNILYVKKYGGKFYIRIEDTNPEKIYTPAYKMLEQEGKWLSENLAEIIIQSERMPLYYKYAEKLIKKSAAYVCTCSQEEFKKFADSKKECPCRNSNAKINLERWKKMLDRKGFKEGEAVLRFKSDMTHKNPAMRDFPLARINETTHPLQKNKYRVWPLMNLSVIVDDIELKMTHLIRGKDHRDNAERQKMVFKVLGKKYPWAFFMGRIHFKGLELSTTEFRKNIEEKKYSGWDDPKLPTLASLKKQGYKPRAFLKFAEQVGLSEVDKIIDKEEYFKFLDAFNRE